MQTGLSQLSAGEWFEGELVGPDAQATEDVRAFQALLLAIEPDTELRLWIVGRTDQDELGALDVEELRIVECDEAPVAEALHQLGWVARPLCRA